MTAPIGDTLVPQEAARQSWDVVVVGAGPAGALAARLAARAGLATLLVERSRLPRDKVCGGCLHPRALTSLRDAGLGDPCRTLGAVPVGNLELSAAGRSLRLPLEGGASLTRATLDAALVRAACEAGAQLLTGTAARPADREGLPTLALTGEAWADVVKARVVLAADGLGGRLLDRGRAWIARRARVGAGAVLDDAGHGQEPGVIRMLCGPSGYVGLAVAEAGRLSVAAALAPRAVAEAGSVGAVVEDLLRRAGQPPLPGLRNARWQGTPPLTRRSRRLAVPGAFALGDAAAFVEPFTGEGMAWAFTSAEAVQPFVRRAVEGWDDRLLTEWPAAWRARVRRRQQVCRGLAWWLRHPRLVDLTLAALSSRPTLVRPLLSRWAER
jgi:flavin-dependent dehydrogenase